MVNYQTLLLLKFWSFEILDSGLDIMNDKHKLKFDQIDKVV